MERQEVYKIIDGERDYEDIKWNHVKNPADNFNSVGDFLIYMDYYFAQAKTNYTIHSGNSMSLDALRKVVALGVACFEKHGVPERKK